MNNIYSFYKLISEFQIEIPIIQRDYAQGRDNSKAKNIRESIIKKIIDSVNNNNPLFFDFIYGRVENKTFIPFDGQQRLTTLFLFHKYIFEKCSSNEKCKNYSECQCNKILNRFTYKTRQSSREFCEKLVLKSIIPENDNKISDYVKNQVWFYSNWNNDPTIIGMLRMLDEIHKQISEIENIDFQKMATNLTSGCICPITFHFVDMEKNKLSDSTYIKMNARGKSLTSFENFKASLEQYLINKTELLERFKGKLNEEKKQTGIDGEWLDLFWTIENKNEKEKSIPDSLIMSIFRRHFLNIYTLNKVRNNNSQNLDRFISNEDFVPFEVYKSIMEEENIGAEKCLTPLFNTFDALLSNSDNILNNALPIWDRENKGWNPLKGNLTNENKETYPSRVAYYAFISYFEKSNDYNESSFSNWMRIVWNIIENSIIDTQATYLSALELMDEITKKIENNFDGIESKLHKIKLDSNHAKGQVKEEKIKSKLIEQNRADWKTLIIEAEKHPLFKGAVRCLFNNNDDENNISFETAKLRWENAQKYFDKNGVTGKYKVDSILLRALISKFTLWEQFWGISYSNNRSTWNYYIKEEKIKEPLSKILDIKDDNELNNFIESSSTLSSLIEKFVHEDMFKSKLFANLNEEVKLNWRRYEKKHALYPSNAKADWKKYVIGNKRNEVFAKLVTNLKIETKQQIKDLPFFWGWDIYFSSIGKKYKWTIYDELYKKSVSDKWEKQEGAKLENIEDYLL